MNSTTFLLNIRPFIYFSLYIILIILFTVSLVTNNLYAFYIFYISLLISTFISNLYSIVTADKEDTTGITFYDSYLLFFNFKKHVSYFLPLFVFTYTISYLLYTSIIVQKITASQIYILLFFLFYFICNLCYMLIIKYAQFGEKKYIIIWYIFSGLILGFVFAYFIDHYINYQLLFFSTYKTRNIQLRCKNI